MKSNKLRFNGIWFLAISFLLYDLESVCAGGGEGNRYALGVEQVTPVAYLQKQQVLSTHWIVCMVYRCWGHQERHDSHRHWMEQCLTHTEKRQSRISFSGVSPPQPGGGTHPSHHGLTLQLTQGDGLCCSQRTLLFFCRKQRQQGVDQMPSDAHA